MALTKQKIKLIFFAVLIGIGMVFFAVSIAETQEGSVSAPNIEYPVPELGNCKNETDCKSYCDKPANIEACINFAEKHNLIPQEEIEQAKKFIAAGGKGPGGCASKESCEAYCNDVNHIEECIAFGEENGLIPPDELEEARKVRDALRKGAQLPGGCRNKRECDAYCSVSEHMEECISFAETAGFIPPEELVDARKAFEAMKKGVKLPPCRGKTECDAYCAEPGNFEVCITFAEAAGFVSSEEAAMARKTGGRGPGNCRDKKECEAFCQNQDNQEICFNFGKEHGLIPEAELQKMEEGKQKMMEGFLNAPPEVSECLTNALGSEYIEKLKSGTALPSRDVGDKMQECFGRMKPPEGDFGPPAGVPDIDNAADCSKFGGDWTADRGCNFGGKECARQGGSWDGQTCIFPGGQFPGIQTEQPGSVTSEGCAQAGGIWTTDHGCDFGGANCSAGSFPKLEGGKYVCFNPMDTPEYCLQQGGNWINEKCDNSGRECAKQGGVWDGSACKFRNRGTGDGDIDQNSCQSQGGDWIDSKCNFGRRECQNQGGAWDGSKCNFYNSSQPQSLIQYSPFGVILNFFLGR